MKAGDSATAGARPESFAKVTEVAAGPKAFAFPALIGDIGGTNVRFATVDSAGRTFSLRRGAVADFAGLNDAIARLAFKDLKEKPLTAVLAVAGPVSGGTAMLTNSGWRADVGELIARFGFGEVVLVNDWIATALALPTLRAGEIDPIGGVRPGHGGTQVAFGPGTGLGVAALTRTRCGWMPLATEGGHVGFGPMNREEHRLWCRLEDAYGRIDAETVLSGPGLLRLREALGAIRREAASPRADGDGVLSCRMSGRLSAASFVTCRFVVAGEDLVDFGRPPCQRLAFRQHDIVLQRCPSESFFEVLPRRSRRENGGHLPIADVSAQGHHLTAIERLNPAVGLRHSLSCSACCVEAPGKSPGTASASMDVYCTIKVRPLRWIKEATIDADRLFLHALDQEGCLTRRIARALYMPGPNGSS